MSKRAKGLDAVRANNRVKKQMLSTCKSYAEQLEKENYDLKHNPDTVIGSFIGQFRELYSQNQRLSTLAACLLKQLGEKSVLSKDEMEQFNGKRINIKWELPEGSTVETATEFTFTYELQDAPPLGQPVQTTEVPGEEAPITVEDVVTTETPIPAVEEGEIPPAVEEPLPQ